MKKIYMYCTIVAAVFFVLFSSKVFANQPKLGSNDENFGKIFAQGKIIQDGYKYLKAFQFHEALTKFEEALNPEVVASDDSQYYPLSLVIRCLTYQRKYEQAEIRNQWYFQQKLFKNVRIDYPAKPKPIKKSTVIDTRVDYEIKLSALKEWKQAGNTKPIYDYIDYMRSKYLYWLPPKSASTTKFSDIAELYDLIGDYDAGITWAALFKKATKDKRYKQEYQNVIKAFEESKQGLPKICGDGGKTCVGRATAYIIQSDQI